MKIMIFLIPLSMSFFLLNHPISMGFSILILTVLICLTTGMMNTSFWFSYILFLIMIGGLIILFIYMTSIASNEKFKFSSKISLMNFISMSMISFWFITNKQMNFNMKITEMFKYTEQINIMTTNLKYFSSSNLYILISAMIYLLITLIMIVKITKKEKGPIRQK